MWDRLRFYIIWYFVIPFVVYGSETWSVNGIDMKRLSTWDRKILRIIKKSTWNRIYWT